jgi:two-component system cell cycle sensor histidine kinase/response regulator CckA
MGIDVFPKKQIPDETGDQPPVGILRGGKSRPVIWPQLRWEGRSFGGRLDMRATVIAMAGLLVALGATLVGAGFGSWQLGASFGGLAITISAFIVLTGRYQAVGLKSGVEAKVIEAVLDSKSEGRVVVNELGEMVAANQRYRKLLGGRLPSPLKLLKNADSEIPVKEFQQKLREEGAASTTVLPGKKGEHRRIELHAKMFGSFEVWRLRKTAVDVTLERAITWAGTTMESNLQALNAGIIVTGPDGVIQYANTIAKKHLGQSLEPLFGQDLEKVLEARGFAEDGTRRGENIDLMRFPMPVMGTKEMAGEIVVFRSVSGRRRTFDDKGFQGLSVIFEDAPMAMVLVDTKGNIREFNRSFASIYKEETNSNPEVGASFFNVAGAGERAAILEALKTAFKHPGQEVPLVLRLGGDSEKVVKAVVGALGSSEAHGAVFYLLDATEQLRLEDQFIQAQKMQAVGQLAGGIAHDFNNLLTAIIGFCDLLLLRHGPGDESFGDLMQVKQNSNRAADLVRQLLAFSRRQTLRPRVLNVTDVLADLANLIRRLIGERINLKIEHGRSISQIKGDQGQLEQVIINLVVNARDAMPEGGALTIKTLAQKVPKAMEIGEFVIAPGDYVQISIKDTGVGIAGADIGKIFEPFFTTKGVGKGTGLGLATVYGIVSQSGGFIDVHSEPGHGTEVLISLPVISEQSEAETAPAEFEDAAPRDLTGREVILIVEDEEPVRIFAARALSNKGYQVIEASDGESALEMMQDQEGGLVDLLVTDVVMPGMDGPTLAEKARQLNPDIKVILVSGYAEEGFRQKLGHRDIAFLPKPFSLNQLAEEVKRALES